jgi:hypothetical protein
MLGVMVAYTPSLVVLALLLWRETRIRGHASVLGGKRES